MKSRGRTEPGGGCGAGSGVAWTAVLCLITVMWCFAASADITYASFPDEGDGTIAGMTLNGNRSQPPFPSLLPRPEGDRLRLTEYGIGDQRGSAWHNTRQYVGDVWETTFRFQYTNNNADGFTFAIHNSPDGAEAVGTDIDGGGGKGYAGMTNCWIVEFDAYHDDMSVHSNGTGVNRHDASTLIATTGFTADDNVHTVRVAHAVDCGISVFLDNMVTPVLTVADSRISDIGWDGGQAYVGFTGATGGGSQTCEIIDWSFTVTDTLAPTNPGVGCHSHVFPSPETTMVIRWSGAEDFGSGVDGYSYVVDTNPTTTPDTVVNVAHTSDPHSVSYDAPGEGTYYVHLRTHDNAGRWSDAVHLGPLVVDFAAPPLPVAGPVVIGLAVAAVVVVGTRVVRRHRV